MADVNNPAFWNEEDIGLLVARYRAEHHIVMRMGEPTPMMVDDEPTIVATMGVSVDADYAMDFEETERLLAIRAEERDALDGMMTFEREFDY